MNAPSWKPHGAALMARFLGDTEAVIDVYTADGDCTPFPAEIYFREYDDFMMSDEPAIRHCYGRVLDVGAGAGALSLVLQDQMGLEVTGLDIAEEAAAVMRQQGLRDARAGDFFALKGESYDTLLLMMNGIGFVGDLDGLDRFFAHARSLLSPGGQVLLDSSDLKLAETPMPLNPEGYYGSVWYRMEFGEIKGEPYHWLYVDHDTLKRRAIAAGWTFELILEGPEGYYLARLCPVE